MRRGCIVSVGCLVLACAVTRTAAITINPTFTGFDATQQDVIQEAINYWATMVGRPTDDPSYNVSIDFIQDPTEGLASTNNWTTNTAGRPTSADISVNAAAYNWTTGAPAAGQIDGLRGMMHEITHAIGWTTNLAHFHAQDTTVGGNRFYDLNHNGVFNAGTDFDLDDTAGGTHAVSGSGDLMQPVAPVGVRLYPTYQHAGVLTDAYDYGVMLDGLGGPEGYGQLSQGRNDDASSNRLNLPFQINFFGNTYGTFFVNNNGNITFNSALGQYTPSPFPIADQPMIAPYWGDVDTRPANGGEVYVASPNADTVVVTWDDVGYYANHTDKTNDFQMVLRNRSDLSPGDFDIEFRYDRLTWTTGDASGGSGGLGGIPAQAGYDAGDRTHYLTLPGSRTAAVLNLDDLTNTPSNVDIDGLWVYAVRNGNPPGTTPDNPLLPVVRDDGWQFDFNIGDTSRPVFIDPVVAIGYDYYVDLGPNFSAVLLPSVGDNLYDLWTWDSVTNSWVDTSIDLTGGVEYDFAAGGLDRFRILGIEESAGLDPFDVTAFVTGLWFVNPGLVTMRQVPVTNAVPAPGALILAGIGLAGLRFARKRLG